MGEVSASGDVIATCAARLAQAEERRQPIEPLTTSLPRLTLVDAYDIQRSNITRRLAQGDRVVGHKVGLTAVAMQELFGVSEPDYGVLLGSMVHDARDPLDLAELIDPQIEVEPAFVLGRQLLGPGLTSADALAAIDHVCVCFEVIDSRIVDWRIRIQDTVADNGSSARIVLGARKMASTALALDNLNAALELDGVAVETGNTAAILGHPAASVAWLANTLSTFDVALEPGDIVLPGTCMRSRRIAGHRRATGRIESLGEVTIQLVNAPAIVRQRP
jgi:2-keto-4-pentenoate hydratase